MLAELAQMECRFVHVLAWGDFIHSCEIRLFHFVLFFPRDRIQSALEDESMFAITVSFILFFPL